MIEITDPTNIAQAYAFMPISWSGGGSLGSVSYCDQSCSSDRIPLIALTLVVHYQSQQISFPTFLETGGFSKNILISWRALCLPRFPFLHAWSHTCSWKRFVCSFFTRCRLVDYRYKTVQYRVSLSQLLKTKFCNISATKSVPPTPDSSSEILGNEDEKPLPLRALLVPRVLIAAGNYAGLSLVDIAFRAVQPIFFSTPIELGGLGLDPPRIGNILSVFGVLNGFFQVFFFANLHDRFGSKAVYSVAVSSCIPLILTFPLLNALARTQGLSWMVWPVVGLHIVLAIAMSLGFCKPTFVDHDLNYSSTSLKLASSSMLRPPPLIGLLWELPMASPSCLFRSRVPLGLPRQRPCFLFLQKIPSMRGLHTILCCCLSPSPLAPHCCCHGTSGTAQWTRTSAFH